MDIEGSGSSRVTELLTRIRLGDRKALDVLLTEQRPQLRAFIARRLTVLLQRRVDASDVVQAVFMEVIRRIDNYIETMPLPFDAWLRKIAFEQILMAQRRHIAAQRRSVRREIHFSDGSRLTALERRLQQAVSDSPTKAVVNDEASATLQSALESLPPNDVEIVQMRLSRGMSFEDIAATLEIKSVTARKRFGRALIKLSVKLKSAGLWEG